MVSSLDLIEMCFIIFLDILKFIRDIFLFIMFLNFFLLILKNVMKYLFRSLVQYVKVCYSMDFGFISVFIYMLIGIQKFINVIEFERIFFIGK